MNGSEKEPLLTSPVISNSGPLITLATIGQLDLLAALFGKIIIPKAVHNEVVVYGEGEPGSREVGEAEWIGTLEVKDRLAIEFLLETLGAGESEAIVLAQELKAEYVLLDDALARRKACLIGLHVTGTLGILLMAQDVGLIPTVKLISDRLYQDVLTKAGEA